MSYWSWERFIPGNSSIPPGYRTNVIALALSHSFSSSVFGVNVLFPWVRFGPYSQYFFVPGVLVNLPLGCGGVRDFEVDYLVTHPWMNRKATLRISPGSRSQLAWGIRILCDHKFLQFLIFGIFVVFSMIPHKSSHKNFLHNQQMGSNFCTATTPTFFLLTRPHSIGGVESWL